MKLGTKIPATVITGFLGAGKTTLVRNLISTAKGKRIALIVNEFGEMGFDGNLLGDCGIPGCAADEIIELTNGCICCTVADDFLPTMESLLNRENTPDHIVIETSGLALPQPLVRAFQWPSVRNQVTVDGVVTIVDCAAVAEGRVAMDEEAVAQQRLEDPTLNHENPIDELFQDQLNCADLVVLNKVDLVDVETLERITDYIKLGSRPNIEIIKSKFGKIPSELLLGLESGAETDMESRKSHHEKFHMKDGTDDHHHDEFESAVLPAQKFQSIEMVEEKIREIMNLPGILRTKGKVHVEGKPGPVMIQAVGPRVQTWFGSPEDSVEGIVVIGLHDFDKEMVESLLTNSKSG